MSFDVTTLALAKSYTNQHGGSGGWPADLPKPSVGGYGYTESSEQTTITWDGDTDGRVVIASLFYKISELTPTIEEMIGGVVYTKSQNDGIFQEEITSDSITTLSEHVYEVKGSGRSRVLVALENDEIEGTIIERGMYYSKEGSGVLSAYVTSLTYGTPDTVHKIDEKYLPVIPAVTNTATVGQTIKVSAVDENGKPTEWEAVDMPSGGGSVPKPLTYDYMPEGYPTKSVGTVTLMEEHELAFTLRNGLYKAQITNAFEIVEGQTYTVNWDETEYECVGVVIESQPALGNLSIVDKGSDTGEPFLYAYNAKQHAGMFVALDTAVSHTISVKTIGETVTPIAEEFLPAGVGTMALITSDSDARTLSSNLTNDELYERLLGGRQVVLYLLNENEYLYLMKWKKNSSGRIDLFFNGESRGISLLTDGTMRPTPIT